MIHGNVNSTIDTNTDFAELTESHGTGIMKAVTSFVVLIAFAVPGTAAAQSLAEIASKEQERRKSVAQPGKVYTNRDLTADITAPAPPTNATPAAPTPGAAPSTQVPSVNLPGGNVDDDGEVRDEAWWRERITTARSALERSRIFADALRSRINALNADYVNRDDPAQRAQLELERQRATAELARVDKEIADQTRAIAEIEEEARKAGVPPGWLR